MRNRSNQAFRSLRKNQRGITIIETLVAAAILSTCLAGLASLFAITRGLNATQGEYATRTTEYAADKIEQLITLPFAAPGLGGNMSANATVGGTTSGTPVTSYVDYIDASGNTLSSSTGAFYTRQWSISTGSSPSRIKTVTVVVRAKAVQGGVTPQSTMVCLRANF